jgi:hypothetical protein
MEIKFLIILFAVLCTTITVITADNNYAIIGSKYVQPGTNFKVFVVSDASNSDPYDLHIELSGNGYPAKKTVRFNESSGEHQEVEFESVSLSD